MKDKALTYILCALGFTVIVSGLHRFYLGKWGTGLLWLLTGGLLGVGTVVDLFLIPGMVDRANARIVAEQRAW